MSISGQVHLRRDSVLLEMVGRSVRGDADHRKRPCGVRAVGVHRRRVEHERRSSFKLHVHCRPIYLGFKVNNICVRFAEPNGYSVSHVLSSPVRSIVNRTSYLYNNTIIKLASVQSVTFGNLNFIRGNEHSSLVKCYLYT